MAVQIVFALVCFAIAVWLAPRWRRMHARGARDGTYSFLTLNVFGSAIVGFALLWAPARALLADYQCWHDERVLARFEIRCDRTSLEIRNRNDSPRRVTVDGVALRSESATLLSEPQSWSVDARPGAIDLAPGQSARFAWSEPHAGPCVDRAGAGFFVEMPVSPAPTCDGVAFHVTSAQSGSAPELDAHATCTFARR
ncbi:MAG TPA: hypothetical protein VLM85_28540 [Polyangiaceae bacterium]|nr:hypothetical protein [Polyangiaceae bacterium]